MHMQHKIVCNKVPEIAGVSMPSPMSIHTPSIAMNSTILRAVMLCSRNFPSLLWLSFLINWLECERSAPVLFDGRMPILV